MDATDSISGGCLCCLADPDELDATLATLTSPELDFDVILVEASGLAEPRELARLVMSSHSPGFRFGGVVELVDAALWASDDAATVAEESGSGTSSGSPTCVDIEGHHELPMAVDHLQVASLLVVNKTDRLEADAVARTRLEADLALHAPDTPVVYTTYGRLDASLLFDTADRPAPTGQLSFTDLLLEQSRSDHPDRTFPESDCAPTTSARRSLTRDGHEHVASCNHPHHASSSVSVSSPLPASPRDLVAFLEQREAGMYRVKGRTWIDGPGGPQGYVVQAVGSWLAFERLPRGNPDDLTTDLVAIGVGMDDADVEAAIRSCLTDSPVPADHMHAVARYVRWVTQPK